MTMLVVRDHRARMLALRSATPPAIEWINAQDAYRCMDEIDATLDPDAPERDRPATYLRQIPEPKLRIDDPGFTLNAFFLGIWFMSAKLRGALGLEDGDAVSRVADVAASPTDHSGMGYAAIAPVHHADGIDPDRSDIEWFGDTGGTTGYWELAIRGPEAPRVVLKPGFVAPAPLFYLDRTDWLAITTDAADRVRSAGIDDVFFDDPFPTYGSWMTARL